jgi:hypothetical protein
MSVIPIRPDGSKRPTLPSWRPFQKEAPSEELVRGWWADGKAGVAVICGKVSGNEECLDFDLGELFAQWCELVEATAPGLVARLTVVRTPREPAAYHVPYRCPEVVVPGNTKLAQRPGTDPETGKPCLVTLIETRGEGGYVLVPGSPPACHPSGHTYEHIAGPPLTELPVLTAAEREALLSAARSFDQGSAARAKRAPGGANRPGAVLRPGDDYDRRGPSWAEVLGPHGWVRVYSRGEVEFWRRPGKDTPGISATTGYCKGQDGADLLAVFSSNAHPFEGPSGARPCTCYGKLAAFALLNHNGDFKAAARELRRQGYGGQGRREDGQPHQGAGPGDDDRPSITITTEEHEVNAEAVTALGRDCAIYQRGGMLVRVVRDASPAAKGIRRPFAPRIEPLPPPLLRERLAANARWVMIKETSSGGAVEMRARPPAWCVSAVHARAGWPGIHHLEAVVDYPVLRPDGTILGRPGYDPETGLLLESAATCPAIPDRPSAAEAIDARDVLLDVVGDFPFEREAHKAAWLAALLTPLARFAFTGPTPLFLVDANVRAAGKGLLLDVISRIVTGERFTIATYTSDEDELRKRITSLVLAGDRLVLFDNLEGKFGNAVLDAALTGTAWKDRVLGANRMAEAPMFMTWYATGNNVIIAADTARRVCHVRLESPEERPEERQDFRRPNLLAWVGENRPRLLAAALSILRGYCAAGRPDQGLPAWGSFEGWSALVRSAVVWVGLPDPGETRLLLQEKADVAAESMAVVLTYWECLDPERRGLTAAEVIQRLYKEQPSVQPDYYADLRDALEALLGKPDARALGNRLRSYRRRVFQGRYIYQASTEHRAARWAVYPAAEFCRRREQTHHTHQTHRVSAGESGECGESFSGEPVPACPGDAWEGDDR